MNRIYNKKKLRKIVSIALVSVLGVLVVFGLSAYLLIHSYIGKVNLVSANDKQNNFEVYLDSENKEEEEVFADTDIDSNTYIYSDTDETEDDEFSLINEENLTASDTDIVHIETLENEIINNMKENSTSIMDDKDVLNILLIGSDSRNSKERGRSDSMILISVNKEEKMITAMSLLRDIYLQIPGRKNNRLNTAYANGGADLLMQTIENNFKIKIDHYVAVDFFSFIDIVDAVGGVTIELSEKEVSATNGYINEINSLEEDEKESELLTFAGEQLLNGTQALGYSRIRSVGNCDFERTDRQRRVLELIFEKIKKLDIIKLNNLLNTILPQVTTNFTEGEIMKQILSLPSYLGFDLQQGRIPINGSYTSMRIRGMAVLGIDFDQNIQELHQRIYLTE